MESDKVCGINVNEVCMENSSVDGSAVDIPGETDGIVNYVPGETCDTVVVLPGESGSIVDGVPGENGVEANNVETNNIPANSVPEPNNSASQPDKLDVQVRSAVNGDSYASRAARTSGSATLTDNALQSSRRSVANDMPKRPRSALFTPSRLTSARSVFDALNRANVDANEIQCLQRKMNSEVVITFKSAAAKEKFLSLNSITIDAESYAIQDIDRPLTFLTVYDAPFELSDWAIIKRLAPFCEVIHYRRGRFDFAPGVYNGLRHYRVRIIKPVPNFLRFGKYQIFLKYAGQPLTCRKCNLPGHFSNVCNNKVCFNCDNFGHEANSCPAPPLCHFCKEDGHLSRDCRYSWVSPVIYAEPTDESATVNVDDDDASDVSDASFKTYSADSFRWADESDLSDAYIENVENLPLAAALSSNAQQPSPVTAESSAIPVTADPPTESSVTPSSAIPVTADPPTESSVPPSSGTPLLCESSESPPNAQPVHSPSVPAAPSSDQSQHVLDSQGFVKPAAIVIDPPSEATSPNPSTSSTARLRISRRTPAPIPEALAAAALRKPTSPTLISGKSRSVASPSVPMDTTSLDLKRKAGTQADVVPKEKREKKKKGKKCRD